MRGEDSLFSDTTNDEREPPIASSHLRFIEHFGRAAGRFSEAGPAGGATARCRDARGSAWG